MIPCIFVFRTLFKNVKGVKILTGKWCDIRGDFVTLQPFRTYLRSEGKRT